VRRDAIVVADRDRAEGAGVVDEALVCRRWDADFSTSTYTSLRFRTASSVPVQRAPREYGDRAEAADRAQLWLALV
jgi:hypothetical protein